YAWSELPDGWTRVGNATATTTVQLAEVSCTPVVPAIPAVEQGHCSTSGAVIDPNVSVGPAEGIVFAIDGDLVPGGTVVVTATLTDGYAWGELPAGWTRVSSTTATYAVTLDAVHCEKPVVPSSPAQPTPVKTVAVNALPSTGQGERGAGETMMLLTLVALSVTLGAAAIAITRRTKRPTR
ncbi:MAG TPA: hypothetical protein VNP95_07950, partial [Thermomicrobiales bacterium]|nr:hypothetical protein [Thermomicrobiales bacterium]